MQQLVAAGIRKRLRGRAGTLLANNINWSSPASPSSPDFQQVNYGITPVPSTHAPSLRNPIKTKIPTAQEGWKKGDSAESRRQAMQDLVEIHKRLRRQTGKPEIAQQALMPATVSWVG